MRLMRWSFKGVCCRISSRPISGFMGQTNIVRSMPCDQKMANALGDHYTLSLLFWGLK
ncbi:hypothetical protein HPHPP41_1626 [Helicobacter pylori Hp P-41]|nr:hypothetical protein HPHPP41_1626 [Helicobacter pylori Hp P-41]